MGLLDTAINAGLGLLGEKPKVPQFKPVDVGKETGKSITENTQNLPALAEFASKFNELSADQMLAALEKMLPGYANLRDKGTANITAMLGGEVPKDVENRLARKAAERGVTLGTSGSGMAENDFLRNFGLTSLQLTQQGLDSASRWMNESAARTPTFDMASAFLPIQARVGLRAAENQFSFQRNWLANQISAMPSPTESAWANAVTSDIGILSSAAGSAVGGAAGAGGGGGGGGL